MLGRQDDNTDLFQCVTMDALVPANHRLRRLNAVLDLSFVRNRVESTYSTLGRTSIDPEVIVRMWILQHLHGFSEREVCDEVQMHAGFRWFCGLSFNDPVPDQSTLVKLRTQKWAGSGLWEDLLREDVRACEAAGISSSARLGVDGTQIQANAATVSLEEIPPTLTLETQSVDTAGIIEATPRPESPPPAPPALTIEEGGRPQGRHLSGDPDWHGERFSNATHRSTTDPDARLYRKGSGQETKLRYLGHYLADVKSGVIYQATATRATGTAEREAALLMLERLDAMDVLPAELAADLGYRDADFLAELLSRGITPLVPLRNECLEEEPVWKRRTKNPRVQEKRDKQLAIIRARNTVRLASRSRRGIQAQRQRTRLEHLFGEAKEHHGLGRAHGRGLVRLTQQVQLTAAVQNLKRLMGIRRLGRATAQSATLTHIAHSPMQRANPALRILTRSQLSCRARVAANSHTLATSTRKLLRVVGIRVRKHYFIPDI